MESKNKARKKGVGKGKWMNKEEKRVKNGEEKGWKEGTSKRVGWKAKRQKEGRKEWKKEKGVKGGEE